VSETTVDVWIVTKNDDDDGPWEIWHDSEVVSTVRSHYDGIEVLRIAERHAGHALSWHLQTGNINATCVLGIWQG